MRGFGTEQTANLLTLIKNSNFIFAKVKFNIKALLFLIKNIRGVWQKNYGTRVFVDEIGLNAKWPAFVVLLEHSSLLIMFKNLC